ncbi:hypothetical protein AHiyo4_47310 [Arthrobacter sp. Hiyo4]|nr:hypothetical protein AHiyo4_47310 [Arthrobacter sp. Hiyo4]
MGRLSGRRVRRSVERGSGDAAGEAGRDFNPAAQPTIPAMNSTFNKLKGSTPAAIAQPTVRAAPVPTQTA